MDHPARGRTLTGEPALIIPDGLDATLVLVRHGESTFIVEERFQGQADPPLSPVGERQAVLVAARLAHPHEPPVLPLPGGAPVELIHSRLRRASQTAAAIEAALAAAAMPALARRPDPGLLEIGQGDWEGLHRDEVATRYAGELDLWRRRPHEGWAPGGESLADVQARVTAALRVLIDRLGHGRELGARDRGLVTGYVDPLSDQPWSILVGHDGVFKVVLLTLFGLPLDRFWMWSMDLCGITVVELRAGHAVLRAHNLTGHIGGLSGTEPGPATAGANDPDDRGGAL